MKIAVGGILQETNTFSPLLTTTQDFQDGFIFRREEIISNLKGKNIEYAGIIRASQELGFEIIPTFAALAWPNGRIKKDSFEYITNELFESFKSAYDYDAAILVLHGAIAAEECNDVCGYVVKNIREIVGEKLIVTTFDMHANITKDITLNSDVVVGYNTYPHIDQEETGYRAAKLAYEILKKGIKPEVVTAKIPLILPPQTTSTFEKPTIDLIRKIRRYLRKNKFYSYFLFFAQPWLDVDDLGCGISITTTKKKVKNAAKVCEEVLEELWNNRYTYGENLNLLSMEDALSMAKKADGLVVLSDAADSPSAGAPGDNVNVLHHLINSDWKEASLMTIYDPEVVKQLIEVGRGIEQNVILGGKFDSVFSEPIEARVAVIDLKDHYCYSLKSKMYGGLKVSAGKTCLLKIKNSNIYVVVTSKRVLDFDDAIYTNFGLNPLNTKLIIVKSALGYKQYYRDKAKLTLDLDNKGLATSNFGILPYKNVHRPIYPLEYYAKLKIDIYQ